VTRRIERLAALIALALPGCAAAPQGEPANNAVAGAAAAFDVNAADDEALRTSPRLPAGFSRNPEADARRAFEAKRVVLLDIGIEMTNLPGWEDPNANPGTCKPWLTSRVVRELANDVVADTRLLSAGMRYVERYNRELRRLCTATPH